jgi:hypothetical protein
MAVRLKQDRSRRSGHEHSKFAQDYNTGPPRLRRTPHQFWRLRVRDVVDNVLAPDYLARDGETELLKIRAQLLIWLARG